MREKDQIPGAWQWQTLGAVCLKIQDGTHFSPKHQLPTGKYPYVTAKNVKPGGLDFSELTYLAEVDHREIYKRCDAAPGDVLLVKDGVNTGDAALNTIDGEISLLSSVCMLRPIPQILSPRFLLYFVQSPTGFRLLTGQMTGTAIKRIILHRIRETAVPIAPLNEQRRIVAKIEELFSDLDAAVAALVRVRANLKRYRAAVLKAAVEGNLTEDWRAKHPDTEPASVLLERILTERHRQWEKDQLAKFAQAGKQPSKGWREKYDEPCPPVLDDLGELEPSWCWATIEQLASTLPGSIQSGPFGSNLLHSEFQSSGVLAIGIDNTLDGRFSMGREHRISERKFEELAKYEARPLDVLITVMATVGRCCVVPESIEKAIITKHVYRITPDKQLANPYYLQLALSGGTSVRKQLFGEVRGQTRPGINGEILRLICIPLPSIGEQAKIVEEVQQQLSILDEIEAQVDANLKRAARLRQGILKRAFEGRLLPQDPTDEPAEKLLERIRQQRQPATTMYNGRMGTRRARRPRRTSDPVLPFPQDDGSGQGGKP
jgi:type I restriction enzyme S subunit